MTGGFQTHYPWSSQGFDVLWYIIFLRITPFPAKGGLELGKGAASHPGLLSQIAFTNDRPAQASW